MGKDPIRELAFIGMKYLWKGIEETNNRRCLRGDRQRQEGELLEYTFYIF